MKDQEYLLLCLVIAMQLLVSLVPRPRPAFRRLQYGKQWKAGQGLGMRLTNCSWLLPLATFYHIIYAPLSTLSINFPHSTSTCVTVQLESFAG